MGNINVITKDEFIASAPKDVQKGIAVSEYVRNETLSRAYANAGYATMTNAERNMVYDRHRSEVVSELEALGIVF